MSVACRYFRQRRCRKGAIRRLCRRGQLVEAKATGGGGLVMGYSSDGGEFRLFERKRLSRYAYIPSEANEQRSLLLDMRGRRPIPRCNLWEVIPSLHRIPPGEVILNRWKFLLLRPVFVHLQRSISRRRRRGVRALRNMRP